MSTATGAAAGREFLTEDRIYHVDPSRGDDGNDGRTPQTAFARIDRAVEVAASVDLFVHDVTIRLAAGTYRESVTLRSTVGSGVVSIIGDTTAPEKVVIAATAADCFAGKAGFSGRYFLKGMKLTTAEAGSGIYAMGGAAAIKFSDLEFGDCAENHLIGMAGAHVQATGDYRISGGGLRHMVAYQTAIVRNNHVTVMVTGRPAFSQCFAHAFALGVVMSSGTVYFGDATGVRYIVSENALMRSNGGGPRHFPGDAPGVADFGGVYT